MIQGAKTILKLDWNRAFEFTWRILVFIVAIGIVIVVTTNWGRWEGGAGWQSTNDAYLQADLTPISAKVGGYLRELPVQDYERVHKDQVIAQLVDDDYRAAVAQAQASIESATAQAAGRQVEGSRGRPTAGEHPDTDGALQRCRRLHAPIARRAS